ncbi:MAG: NADP(H)-dependent aldo-keto reductase [Zetaproteobacteria bacterium]|nr:MAG: NADP(H)-dependent aldo-keto reductase [Zetaproteobacteria bacterium]
MQYANLGTAGMQVSRLALGTMTWGEQNTAKDAFEQLAMALDAGVNLIDTAELYSIPPRPETYGATETILGNWFRKTGRRQDVLLATKVCGPTHWCPHIREGKARLDKKNILEACEGSLRRLGTDYLDLYQIHWPDRNTNFFGRLGYEHDPDESMTPIEETLEALSILVEQGKVRVIGVSNETPWGVMRYLSLAEQRGWPRIVSIQNPYNLLNRSFEIGLAEISCREDVGLLAYSPLAFGVLSGKYLDGNKPAGSRLTLFEQYTRYSTAQGRAATRAYVELARNYGMDPAQMALAFVLRQPFVRSVIIGATNLEQLRANLDSIELYLPDSLLEDIESVHRRYPNPCP